MTNLHSIQRVLTALQQKAELREKLPPNASPEETVKTLVAISAEIGIPISSEEWAQHLALCKTSRELNDDDLDRVAGGAHWLIEWIVAHSAPIEDQEY